MAGSAAHGLRGADAAGLHDGVLAVGDVNVGGGGCPDAGHSLSGMFVQVMEYRQPVFFS
jgi:hypothetical protein